jgi:hypothetical protein
VLGGGLGGAGPRGDPGGRRRAAGAGRARWLGGRLGPGAPHRVLLCVLGNNNLSESAEQVVGASRASCQSLQKKSSEYK